MSLSRKMPVFDSLSRRKRRRQVIRFKNLIHRERARCGGVFYDECDFDSEESSGVYAMGWRDIFFIGKDPAVMWNAELMTAKTVFNDIVLSMAFHEASIKLNGRKEDVAFNHGSLSPHNAHCYAVFGGLTFIQYIQKREREIARHEPPQVHCCYQFLPGYTCGSGLRMIIDAHFLSRQVVEKAIADFRLRGECEWYSPEPIAL